MHICHLNRVDSTNNFLKQYIRLFNPVPPFAVYADYQQSGRGQGNNNWESEPGKNLLASFLLPGGFKASQLVIQSMAIALSVLDVMDQLGVNCSIKWPNDLMVDESKIAGILIENTIVGTNVKYSIAGIGINVNQSRFTTPGVTSLKLVMNKSYEIKELLQKIYISIYKQWTGSLNNVLQRANQRLYKSGEWVNFKIGSEEHHYQVNGIGEDGGLRVFDGTTQLNLDYQNAKWIRSGSA